MFGRFLRCGRMTALTIITVLFAWVGLGFVLSLVLAITGFWRALGDINPEAE